MTRYLSQISMTAIFAASLLLLAGTPSLALSQLGPAPASPHSERPQPPAVEAAQANPLPQPGPAINRPEQGAGQAPGQGSAPKPATPATGATKPAPDDGGPVEIIRDMSKLPAAVQQTRQQLVEAAASGDLERLRPLIGTGPKAAQIMNGEFEDPLETLKSFSGDAEGQEILAILLDILSTGAAHTDIGTPDEAYVWPYFTGKALDTLTPPERVDLLRIVTAGDLAGMQENGAYNFFRAGIAPDGKWKFFTGGD